MTEEQKWKIIEDTHNGIRWEWHTIGAEDCVNCEHNVEDGVCSGKLCPMLDWNPYTLGQEIRDDRIYRIVPEVFVGNTFDYRSLQIYPDSTISRNYYFHGTQAECEAFLKNNYGVMKCIKRRSARNKEETTYGLNIGDLLVHQNRFWTDSGSLKCVFHGTKQECESWIANINTPSFYEVTCERGNEMYNNRQSKYGEFVTTKVCNELLKLVKEKESVAGSSSIDSQYIEQLISQLGIEIIENVNP